jgi:hypothetical protein
VRAESVVGGSPEDAAVVLHHVSALLVLVHQLVQWWKRVVRIRVKPADKDGANLKPATDLEDAYHPLRQVRRIIPRIPLVLCLAVGLVRGPPVANAVSLVSYSASKRKQVLRIAWEGI